MAYNSTHFGLLKSFSWNTRFYASTRTYRRMGGWMDVTLTLRCVFRPLTSITHRRSWSVQHEASITYKLDDRHVTEVIAQPTTVFGYTRIVTVWGCVTKIVYHEIGSRFCSASFYVFCRNRACRLTAIVWVTGPAKKSLEVSTYRQTSNISPNFVGNKNSRSLRLRWSWSIDDLL